jgi:hypothetical protein
MELVLSHAAEIGLGSLGDEDRRKVSAWFDYLRNWENDPFVRSKSHKLALPGPDEVYVLRTTTDVRVFFILRSDRIEVIDIARSDSLLRTVKQAS